MRAWVFAVALCVAGCTGHGADRSGAVPVRAGLELRPVAEGNPYVERLASAVGPGPVEVEGQPLDSARLPPVTGYTFRATRSLLRNALVFHGAPPTGIAPVFEGREPAAMVFVDKDGGFVLGPNTTAKVADTKTDQPGVYLFMNRDDGGAFETLTVSTLGRRIALVQGDEALMVPVVQDVIDGGAVFITPGADESPQALLQRLVENPS